jgi:type IV pilus assembly protein PilY1
MSVPVNRAFILAALMGMMLPLAVRAQSLPAHTVPPVVLILLDTSGSMEYDAAGSLTETGENDADLPDSLSVPICNGIGDSGKSRFIVAQEVLAGSFDEYFCTYEDRDDEALAPCPREDCPYPVPHIVPQGTQVDNGLLDLTSRDFKYGVMTFDVNPDDDTGVGGGYSFGPENGVNYGARNESAPTGPFVRPSTSDDPADIAAVNELVQDSIMSAIPYGGTPIAPMLYDALHYFESDLDMLTDPYRACRNRSVVLISDGRANLGTDPQVSPYLDPVAQAQALRDAGINVYVIGYQLAPGVDTWFERMATNDGQLNLPLYRADNSVDLVLAFTQILGTMAVATQSRTRTVVTNETGNTTDVQYQFNAAHKLALATSGLEYIPGVRQGVLEQSVYQCHADAPNPNESILARIRRLSDLLNARDDSSRNIYTWLGGQIQAFTIGNNSLNHQDFDSPHPADPFPDFGLNPATGLCKTGFLSGTPPEKWSAWRNNLINWVRAADDSCRAGYKMGAIDHSTPVIQGRLAELDVPIPSFRAYKESIQERPIMMYTATYDGLLHAFNVGRSSAATIPADWGREEWAFIPPHVLPRLQHLPGATLTTVLDGSPVIKDIVLSRDNAQATGTEGASDWKSVMVVGARGGGRGYAALDVTNPRNGQFQFMWDISADGGRCAAADGSCNVGGELAYENDFRNLGSAFSKPVIGTVSICPSGLASCSVASLREVAVAVFGGGKNEGRGGWVGRTLFVVELETGKKLMEFVPGTSAMDASCAATPDPFLADLAGDVSCYSTFTGTFISRCFIGDTAGRLWRVELGSPGIPDWSMSLFYDPYASVSPVEPLTSVVRAPAYEAPSLAIQPFRNQLVIVYGSGDMDALSSTSPKAFVASLTEVVEPYPLAQIPDRTCSPWTDTLCRKIYVTQGKQVGPLVNWKYFFGYNSGLDLIAGEKPGERMMGPPVIFSNAAYFTTFTPNPDSPCEPGIGKGYGVSFVNNGGDCQTFDPRLPSASDPNLYVASEDVGAGGSGSIPFGLTVVTRPACYQGSSFAEATVPSGPDGGARFASMTPPTPQLVIQTGVLAETAKEVPSQGSTLRSIHQALRGISRAVESLFVSSWGSVFD